MRSKITILILTAIMVLPAGCRDDSSSETDTTIEKVESKPKILDKQIVEMEIQNPSDGTIGLGYGNCQWLYPLDEPQDKLLRQPAYKSEKPYYYAAQYGDAEDNIHTLVLDESQGTGTLAD